METPFLFRKKEESTMSEKMKAVVFNGVNDVHVEEFDIPTPEGDEVLVKIDACAICTWEQRVYKGVKKVDFPFVGGHEMVGKIIALGPKVDTLQWHVGDRVAVGVTLPCGQCYQCKNGNEQNCEHFNHTQPIKGLPYKGMGGLCSHFVVSQNNLFKFYNVPSEEATITEPLSCVTRSVETADIKLGDVVVVIGCGIMGLLHATLAQRKGAMVIVSDTNDSRTELALKLGAKYRINPAKEDLIEKVKEYTNGTKAQVVFDTTPIAAVVKDAMGCLANNGRLVLYSSFYPDVPVEFSPDWLHKSAVKLMGTANSNARDFVAATRMISQGTVDMKPFISEVYPVEKVKEAFESACKGDKFRVVVTF